VGSGHGQLRQRISFPLASAPRRPARLGWKAALCAPSPCTKRGSDAHDRLQNAASYLTVHLMRHGQQSAEPIKDGSFLFNIIDSSFVGSFQKTKKIKDGSPLPTTRKPLTRSSNPII